MSEELRYDGTGSDSTLVFQPYYKEYKLKKNAKTGADFQIEGLHFNGATSVIAFTDKTDKDGNKIVLGTFTEHHASAKFTQGKPDGVRLLGAAARSLKIEGSAQEIVDAFNESLDEEGATATLNIKKTDKGVLWAFNQGGV